MMHVVCMYVYMYEGHPALRGSKYLVVALHVEKAPEERKENISEKQKKDFLNNVHAQYVPLFLPFFMLST